ncbi:MAG: hypothetical protein KGM91_08685 [Burkholderiales bacterium]|nr:hypothetical protein [Burkholderiales bacterium]
MSMPHSTAAGSDRRLGVALLALNLVIMLFPPIYLGMAHGDRVLAMTYFIGSPLVLIASMFVLSARERRSGAGGVA